MNRQYQQREPRSMKQINQAQVERLEETLGIEGAARMMRVGLEAMKELVDKGEVPAVRLNQKHTVMLREDLIDFLRSEGRKQAAERRKSANCKQSGQTENNSSLTRKPARPRRINPPDLRAYERADHTR